MHSCKYHSYSLVRFHCRAAGTLAKDELCCCIQEQDLVSGQYVDAINSLLVSGEYPFLFTNDELDSLLLVSLAVTVLLI